MLACQDCEKYLYAFLDNALDVKETLDVQEHLRTCTHCADRAEAERALKAFVRQQATTPSLPEHRKRQIVRNAMRSSGSPSWRKPQKVAVHLRDIAIGMVAAAAILILVLRPVMYTDRADNVMQKLSREASMAYSVYANQYQSSEVMRSDDTAVIEWVKGRLGSRHKMPWITEQGVQFLGGRLCRILDRKSAVLAYRRQGENVLLFAFKGDPFPPFTKNMVRVGGQSWYVQTVSGRLVAIWQHDGTTYSMVGNLPRDALLRLATTINYR